MKILISLLAIAVIAFAAYTFLGSQPRPNETPSNTSNSNAAETLSEEKSGNNNAFAALISKSAQGADVFILEPGDGTTVGSPLTVKFGITNMTLAKAGDQTEFSGHHHLLINVDQLPDMTAPLPATDQVIHFGGAQTDTTIELPPGQHTLQLLLGNHAHIPHDTPVISKKIRITVK